MKIFCVGRNYAAHAMELENDIPDRPLIFMKPATAILHKERDFFIPEFSDNIHYEGELVLKIGKNGRSVQKKFADSYISHITVGLDFTARDLQDELKSKGHPWEIAKAFDNSAVLGEWQDYDQFRNKLLQFQLLKNGEQVQHGDSSLLLFSFDDIITYISSFFTLQNGDCIFTGTPAGVGPVASGDKLEGILMGKSVMNCNIR
ncbi:MAG TPA: fumarylacetoacetate hydrolase family protein [Saprospiraceae bacterium]|nr:fumarylacetoacetate hydrolase family protein [Saprospiraceae bacterium]